MSWVARGLPSSIHVYVLALPTKRAQKQWPWFPNRSLIKGNGAPWTYGWFQNCVRGNSQSRATYNSQTKEWRHCQKYIPVAFITRHSAILTHMGRRSWVHVLRPPYTHSRHTHTRVHNLDWLKLGLGRGMGPYWRCLPFYHSVSLMKEINTLKN